MNGITRNRVKYFTEDEKRRFLETVQAEGNRRDQVIFSLFLATGMRISELNTLTVGKAQGRPVLTVIGKGHRAREIPLLPGIRQKLTAFLSWKQENGESIHPNAPLFCNNRTSKRLSNRAIQHRVKHYCLRANLGRALSPHAFRHTVGYAMGKAGEPIQVIQTLLGHSNINTTRIYVEPDLDQITASMSRSLSAS